MVESSPYPPLSALACRGLGSYLSELDPNKQHTDDVLETLLNLTQQYVYLSFGIAAAGVYKAGQRDWGRSPGGGGEGEGGGGQE